VNVAAVLKAKTTKETKTAAQAGAFAAAAKGLGAAKKELNVKKKMNKRNFGR
jgi:hypothetical protein